MGVGVTGDGCYHRRPGFAPPPHPFPAAVFKPPCNSCCRCLVPCAQKHWRVFQAAKEAARLTEALRHDADEQGEEEEEEEEDYDETYEVRDELAGSEEDGAQVGVLHACRHAGPSLGRDASATRWDVCYGCMSDIRGDKFIAPLLHVLQDQMPCLNRAAVCSVG